MENKLLDGKAQSIAEFLYKEEGLNKTAIGEFLGERWGDEGGWNQVENWWGPWGKTRGVQENGNKLDFIVVSKGEHTAKNSFGLIWFSFRQELHLQTLKAFVALHEFSDLNLVQALRSVLFHRHAPE